MTDLPAWAQQATAPQAPKWAVPSWASQPQAPAAKPPEPGLLSRVGGPIMREGKRIGSAALEGFDIAPSNEERLAGQKSYGKLGEAVATGLTETARLPGAVLNAGTNALSQALVDMGLGSKGRTPEEQRGEIAGNLGLLLTGAGMEAPVGLPKAEGARAPVEAPKPRVEPPSLPTGPTPFDNLIPRNPEGRPVVPPGGLPPEAAPAPDPRAAQAGQAAVSKVADRIAPPKWAAEPEAKPAGESITFQGKTYTGATKLDAVKAAQMATNTSIDRIWSDIHPDPAPGAAKSAGAAATPLHQLLEQNKADYEAKQPGAPGMAEMAKRGVNMVKGVLAPETLRGPLRGDAAAASIRKNFGRMAQEEARSAAAMDAYRDVMRKLPLEQQLDVLEWLQTPEDAMQKRAKTAYTFEPPTELKPFLQGFRDLMVKWRIALESRGKTAEMGFKDDYVPQMWRDPDAARAKLLEGGGAKQGSGGFTKKSVLASYREGIKEGLVPVTTDPVEIAMRYVENVSRYIALNDTLEEGAANHDIVWRAPNHAPTGWVKLEGRAKTFKGGGMQDAYAPPGFATVYNNFVSHSPNTPMGDLLKAAQRVSNVSSMLQLGLSGYHLTNIAGEAMVSGLANAIDEAAGGDLMTAAVKAASAYGKPITSVRRGMQLRDAYLDKSTGSPMLKKIAQLAADANFRVVGHGRAADEYRFSNVMSLWESWRKGLLGEHTRDALKDIKASPVAGTVRQVAGLTARALQSLSDPLFKHYIPLVKNGAFYDMVATWLKQNPGASEAEQVAFARKASDTIDNRFGEMNQDNIFWPRWQKQLAQSSLLSYSYTLGTARLGVNTSGDILALPGRTAKGEKKWTNDLSYALALPIMIGTVGAVYQFLHTGKPPKDTNDLFHPQTGGTDPSTGKPERAVIPSYMKTVYSFANDPVGELGNKVNPLWKNVYEALRNQDWRGDVIGQNTSPLVEQMAKRFAHATDSLMPLVFQQPSKGGSNISGAERFMGVQGANMKATDPQAFDKMMQKKGREQDAVKALHDLNAQRAAKGMGPLRGRGASEFIRHWRPAYKGTVQ